MSNHKKSVPFLAAALFSCLGGTAIMWLIFASGIIGDAATCFFLSVFVSALLPAVVYAKFSSRFKAAENKAAALLHIGVWALLNALLIIPTVAIYGQFAKDDGSFIPDITPIVLPAVFCVTSAVLAAIFTAIARRAKLGSTTENR